MLQLGTVSLQNPVSEQDIEELDPVVFKVYPALHEKEIVLLNGYCPFTLELLLLSLPLISSITSQVTEI